MLRIILALLVMCFLLSCSGEKKEGSAADEKAAEEVSKEPVQMIPDEEFTEFDKLLNAYIKPYFDKEGTITEKEVSPGESFEIYVFGEYNDVYGMSASEYKLVLPEGIEVLGEVKSDSTVMTAGSFKKDYLMTFRCAKGQTFMMMKYNCQAIR